MGYSAEMKALLRGEVESVNTRQIVYPVGAGVAAVSDNAAAAWAWSAWVQVVAAVANPCWLAGISFHTPAVAVFYGDLEIGSGAALAEVALAMFPVRSIFAGATIQLDATPTDAPIMLRFPIRIAGGPRLAVRIRKDTGADFAGGTLKVICLTGLGT